MMAGYELPHDAAPHLRNRSSRSKRLGARRGEPQLHMTQNADLPVAARVASQAETIVNTLTETTYQYHEHIIAGNGVYDCDCSQFVGFVLEAVVPAAYAAIPKEPDQPRPRAFEYDVFFQGLAAKSSGGWSAVATLAAAQRGDIITWRFPTVQVGSDTGHVVFVAATPFVDASGALAVRVYDSADRAHFEDTRGTQAGRFANGVGSGFINFQVDATGAPIGFQFAPGEPFTHLSIAIGRLAADAG